MSTLKIATFNCRSLKNSKCEIIRLCDTHDIVCLQEHWLLPCDLSLLFNLHVDFTGIGYSAVNIDDGLLIGRPYGGTAILFRKSIAKSITVIPTSNSRVTAVKVTSAQCNFVLLSVYMPTNYSNVDSLNDYVDMCAYLEALMLESDCRHFCITGDMNCQPGSRFFPILSQFAKDNCLHMSDLDRLSNVYTYFGNDNISCSWIDHVLATHDINNLISNISVLLEYICSDHKPMSLTICCSLLDDQSNVNGGPEVVSNHAENAKFAWDKASNEHIMRYQSFLDSALQQIEFPSCYSKTCDNAQNTALIDKYYLNITNCIKSAAFNNIPLCKVSGNYTVTGWNDYVSEKHSEARQAFLKWCSLGKPRSGWFFNTMQNTRLAFKYALRYVRKHEEQVRADLCDTNLNYNNSADFWHSVNKMSTNKATKNVDTINGVTGDNHIAKLWKNHFESIYNSVHDENAKLSFVNRVNQLHGGYNINFLDISRAVHSQKKGKAAGPDGIFTEALMFGGNRLYVHLALFFNLCLKHCYFPSEFMLCVIMPLLKNKNGNSADMNNYRAIAISNSMTKVFESVILECVNFSDKSDMYQFGFKQGLSTTICTDVFKKVVNYYRNRGSHVFACFVDFSKAFDRVNYWKLFNQLLDNNVDSGIVKVLAYWYSHQKMCVRWNNCCSEYFNVSNGTKQGGILSPLFFAKYISKLIGALINSQVGCNIGGVFYNVLAYADDLVLLAPCWRAMQELLNILQVQATNINMSCNVSKTCCMIFNPVCKFKIVSDNFKSLCIGIDKIKYVDSYKYLGHMITNNLNDESDVKRVIRNLYVRCNILFRRYNKCSRRVKIKLYQAFCLCFYGIALWRNLSRTVEKCFKSCYNRCMKFFFGFRKYDSVTNMLLELGLPSYNTILLNNKKSFANILSKCTNDLVVNLCSIYDSF